MRYPVASTGSATGHCVSPHVGKTESLSLSKEKDPHSTLYECGSLRMDDGALSIKRLGGIESGLSIDN